MTTSPHDTKEFWDDIKVNHIARAKDIAALGSDEIEALQCLRWSSSSLSESVEYFVDLEYDELVNIVRCSDLICEKFGWELSDCKDKLDIAHKSSTLAGLIQECSGRLTLPQVQKFGVLSHHISRYLRCKPTTYQMEQFTKHGITWEGEVRDY